MSITIWSTYYEAAEVGHNPNLKALLKFCTIKNLSKN